MEIANELVKGVFLDATTFEIDHEEKEAGKKHVIYKGAHAGYCLEATMNDGKKEGDALLRDGIGKLIARVVFANDSIDGPFSLLGEGEKVVMSGLMKGGLRDGVCCEYDTEGKISTIDLYEMGVKSGTVKKIDSLPNVYCEISASNEIRFAGELTTTYMREGKGVEYEKNLPKRLCSYSQNRMVHVIKEFSEKEMKEYDESGELVYKGEFCNCIEYWFPRHGKGEWYNDGMKRYQGEWCNDVMHGEGVLYGEEEKDEVVYEGAFRYGFIEDKCFYTDIESGETIRVKRSCVQEDDIENALYAGNREVRELDIVGDDEKWYLEEHYELQEAEKPVVRRKLIKHKCCGKTSMCSKQYMWSCIIAWVVVLGALVTVACVYMDDLIKVIRTRYGTGNYPFELKKCDMKLIPYYVSALTVGNRICTTEAIETLTFSSLEGLKTIVIGDESFLKTDKLMIRSMKYLKTIEIGRKSLMNVHEIALESLNMLTDIILHDEVMAGDSSDARKNSANFPYNYINTLLFRNLPALKSLVLDGEGQFEFIGIATLENVPALEEKAIEAANGDGQFALTYEITVTNADGLRDFIKLYTYAGGLGSYTLQSCDFTLIPRNVSELTLKGAVCRDVKETEFKVSNFRYLKSIEIGSLFSKFVQRFAVSSLKSLESFTVQRSNFYYIQDVVFEDLPQLKSIILYDDVFSGDDSASRREKDVEPYNFKNSLTMKNLRQLHSMQFNGNYIFYSTGHVYLENVSIARNEIVDAGNNNCRYVFDLSASNADGLKAYINEVRYKG